LSISGGQMWESLGNSVEPRRSERHGPRERDKISEGHGFSRANKAFFNPLSS
jgi:hypothetical protein